MQRLDVPRLDLIFIPAIYPARGDKGCPTLFSRYCLTWGGRKTNTSVRRKSGWGLTLKSPLKSRVGSSLATGINLYKTCMDIGIFSISPSPKQVPRNARA